MSKLKHIFVFIFFVSVTALSFQGMVTYLLKEGNALKKQLCTNNIPVSEEEDETEEETALTLKTRGRAVGLSHRV
mgnify:CR=1 FL=1